MFKVTHQATGASVIRNPHSLTPNLMLCPLHDTASQTLAYALVQATLNKLGKDWPPTVQEVTILHSDFTEYSLIVSSGLSLGADA